MQRRRWNTWTMLAIITGLIVSLAAAPTALARPNDPPPSASAERLVAGMQPGWNLGNTLDSVGADETAWGNPRVTPELLRAIKREGFNSIRIPVTWGQYDSGAPDYTIDPEVLDRVAEVVDWSLDAKLAVLLNVHHDSWLWLNQAPNEPEAKEHFLALWRQIADRFRDYPRTVLLESINEPQFAGVTDEQAYAVLDDLNQAFVHEVRATGGPNATRVLVLPTLHTDSGQARLDSLLETFTALDDPNLAATFHYYGYWPFSVNVAGGYRFDVAAQNDMLGAFDRVKTTLRDHGIPVILGEYGLLGFDRHTGTIEQGEKLKFFEMFGYLARTNDITTMLWDNGQHFNRTTHEWRDPALMDQIKSSWKVRSGTASSDLLFVEDGTVDQSLTINRNGRNLTGVWLDGKQLKKGRDYTLIGDQITFKESFLQRVAGDGEYGVRAVLSISFNRGVTWEVNVIRYATPVLSSTIGTTSNFLIPTQFNGDRLATMEAKYEDGSFAGPHNWTSFKEFDATFAPEADGIRIREAFFKEVANPATVILTFHFWSGKQLTYSLSVDGDVVTGTPLP